MLKRLLRMIPTVETCLLERAVADSLLLLVGSLEANQTTAGEGERLGDQKSNSRQMRSEWTDATRSHIRQSPVPLKLSGYKALQQWPLRCPSETTVIHPGRETPLS